MKIEIEFPPGWRQYLPKDNAGMFWHKGRGALCFQMETLQGETLENVLKIIGYFEVGLPPGESKTVLVNGRFAVRGCPLQNGDVIRIVSGAVFGG